MIFIQYIKSANKHVKMELTGNSQIYILNEGFLTDHSEALGLVFDMPLCTLALWHLLRFSVRINCKTSGSAK